MTEASNNKFDHSETDEAVSSTREEKMPPREPMEMKISDVDLEKLKQEAQDFKDKYQRSLAEGENARKRMQKEKQDLIQYAVQSAMVDFLAPIDHLENALQYAEQGSKEIKHWASGFHMILNQFKDILNNNGVKPFKSVGMHFDPHYHEAVETITTTEHPSGTVLSESLKGYKMGDKIIRPARVKVAKAPQEIPKKNEQTIEEINTEEEQNSKE